MQQSYKYKYNIVNNIDCLQVWQHASGANLYLRVNTYNGNWMIGSTIDGYDDDRIRSPSAGGQCPSDASNSISRRNNLSSWMYDDDGRWVSGDIRVIGISFK